MKPATPLDGWDPEAVKGPASLARVALVLFQARDAADVMERATLLATAAIDHCDEAGVTLAGPSAMANPVATSEAVSRLDDLQLEVGEGPCVDAALGDEIVETADLLAEQRWPVLSARLRESGTDLRSVLSARFDIQDQASGALNLYAAHADAFTAEDRLRAAVLAAQTAAAIATFYRLEHARTADGLRIALESRDTIGQAKGILMERHRITPDEAFDRLRDVSQRINVKLRDVAEHLVSTGELLGEGGR